MSEEGQTTRKEIKINLSEKDKVWWYKHEVCRYFQQECWSHVGYHYVCVRHLNLE